MRVVYVSFTGLLEPLGQSQIFPYLRGLSPNYQITVITFEKQSYLINLKGFYALDAECKRLGIRWKPCRFRSKPRFLATAVNLLKMFQLLVCEVLFSRISLIHARSYLPAGVALIISLISRIPFVFDMRALWVEELITSGRVRRGSALHLLLFHLERACLSNAAAVVLLTHAAKSYLSETHPVAMKSAELTIIPTCTDLNRFLPSQERSQSNVIGCLGTLLSGWFRLDMLSAFFRYGARHYPQLRFQIITLDDERTLRGIIGDEAEFQEKLTVEAVDPETIPRVIKNQVASVMFYAGGNASELGRSPTRMGEILSSGIPLVANEGVGDVADIIRKYKVGVIVDGISDSQLCKAWKELDELLSDSFVGARCRHAAEVIFSLDAGIKKYEGIYETIGRSQILRHL